MIVGRPSNVAPVNHEVLRGRTSRCRIKSMQHGVMKVFGFVYRLKQESWRLASTYLKPRKRFQVPLSYALPVSILRTVSQ